ncbi:MAG: AAA family ATPase, partial [Candidatus Bathyarchaeota archaeon]
GEAGIGKTRFANQIVSFADHKKIDVLYSSCPLFFKKNGASPYILWRQVIRNSIFDSNSSQLRKYLGDYPAEICKLVPEIEKKLGRISESAVMSPELEKDRLNEAVSQFISNFSKDRPIIIILDDLQWADSSSLNLLHYLARGVYRYPILLIGLYRELEDIESELNLVLRELNRERVSRTIKLKRFNLNETVEHIKQILGQDEVPQDFCELIYKKTNGNPFFIEEVLKSLKNNGLIYLEKNVYRVKKLSKIIFPETVKTVFEAKLNGLDADSRNLLTLASCIGNEFSVEVLSRISEYKKHKIIEIIDKLLELGLLKSKIVHREIRCVFSDIVIRNILYEQISPFKLKYIHSKIAEALEDVYSQNISEYFSELALHYLSSGIEDKALDYFLKAGNQAKHVYANDEAEFYFRSALTILKEKQAKPHELAKVTEILGNINKHIGNYKRSISLWNEALLLWKDMNQKEKVADLHLKISHLFWCNIGDVKKAKEHQNYALKILEDKSQSKEIAALNADMAQMYFRIGDLKKSFSLVNKALKIAKEIGAYGVIGTSNLTLGALFNLNGDYNNAIVCFENALEVSLENNFLETAVYAYDNLGWALKATREKSKCLESYKKGYDLAKRIGAISALSWIGNNLSELYFDMGKTSQALILSEESVSFDRKTGNQINLALSLGEMGYILGILGELDKSESCLNEALEISGRINDFPAIGLTYKALGKYHINKRNFEEGQKYSEKALELAKKTGSKMHQVLAGYYLALCSIELNEQCKAEKQIENLLELTKEVGDKERAAYVLGLKGMLSKSKKNWNQAIKYFDSSIKKLEVLDVQTWDLYEFSKRIILEYGQVYLERNQKGDQNKAKVLLQKALKAFNKIGAKEDIALVEAQLFNLDVPQKIIRAKDKVPFGFSILDKMLYGGIPSKFSISLSSPPNDQKNLVIRRFLETGLNQGEFTFHITSEIRLPESVIKEHKSEYFLFYCNPRSDSSVSNILNLSKLNGVTDLTNLSIALTKAYRVIDQPSSIPRRACVEIVSDVLLESGVKSTRRWLENLLHNLKEKGFTTLVSLNPLMHTTEDLHSILSLFDGEIRIREEETKKGVDRLLKILRLKNQKHAKNEVYLVKDF